MPNLRFDHPELLLLSLIALPLLWIGWRALSLTDGLRRAMALVFRAALLFVLAFILAGPHMLREHNQLTVIGLLDISGSVQRFGDLPPLNEDAATRPGEAASQADADAPIRRSNIEYLRRWFRQATKVKAPDDRFGLVVFDGSAIAISAPTKVDYVDDNLDVQIAQGTNIAEAVRLGLAMFPADTSKRLVLVTDGNETAGSVLDAIKQARADVELAVVPASAGGSQTKTRNPKSAIPIDILPIAYHVTGDVQVVRIETPPSAQPGQAITVRIILEAASPASGRLTLRHEGVPVDLNGSLPGFARHVDLPAGQSVHLAQVTLGQLPINRFEAIFEADDPTLDVLPDNNRAEAFTATPSKGSVLIVDSKAGRRESMLAAILNAADLPAQVQPPEQLPDDLLSLQNYDLVVLNNVAAAEITSRQQQMLTKYVNDLGGGLIMIGGENSFGAGGWNGTPIEAVLPVELDPSKELRLPTAALVLVLDKSGSMNQGVAGARASKQQVANEGAALAIESLRSDSLIGVITFDMFSSTLVPLQRNDNPKKTAAKVRTIHAEGGTNLEPALERAFDMLKDAQVAKKRVVCMTDGRSNSNDGLDEIAKRMADNNIQLSTIAVGDDADFETLEKLAKTGGGDFYEVRDPRRLPRVLIDSVQVINKPLLKDITFVPHVLATGSTLTAGMDAAPPLNGLVITSQRNDPKVSLEMIDPDGEPLLAYWQAGLGRAAAFTSEAPGEGQWSQRWDDWPTAATFWTQLARTIARPAMNRDGELTAAIQNDRLDISFELNAMSDQSGSSPDLPDYLQIDGTVYKPDGTSVPVRLRQGAPGRYEAAVDATLAGNYIVALNPRQGTRQLAPAIGGASRSTSPEFRRYSSNLGLLEEIVETTNGRRLDVKNPLAFNLFDRTGMPPSVSSLPIWRMLLFWCLGLLLLDVACRRIAWDSNLLRDWARRAIARVTPAHVRGGEAAATLATLRRVSDEVETRHSVRGVAIDRAAPGNEVGEAIVTIESPAPAPAAGNEPTTHTWRPEPEPSKVAAALDAMLGRTKDPPTPGAPPTTAAPDRADAAAETTGNLLAAKRRARQRLQDESKPDDGSPRSI